MGIVSGLAWPLSFRPSFRLWSTLEFEALYLLSHVISPVKG